MWLDKSLAERLHEFEFPGRVLTLLQLYDLNCCRARSGASKEQGEPITASTMWPGSSSQGL